MAGFSGMRSVIVWLQASGEGQAQLEYWEAGAPAKALKSGAIALRAEHDFTARIAIDALRPGTAYDYRVLIDGKPAERAGTSRFSTQALWQWRGDAPNFSVVLGSCAYINDAEYDRPGQSYGGGYEIFGAMAAKRPDMVLWLGDNVYFREADYSSPGGMAYRYRHDRALPELQALLRTGHHYAIWDDHDYGPDNANSSFIYKDVSLELFKRYWANPSHGLPKVPGIFTIATFNDVEFYLLDDRWYRDSDKEAEVPGKTMFGRPQLEWLRNALLNSTAAFKVIVAGGQMLNEINRFEGWRNFSAERREFLGWLGQHRINGVFFLSGDRHHTELIRLERVRGYPLYDLTCSPLTAGVHNVARERDKPSLVADTYVGERNFCSLEFSGARAQRRVMMRSFDSKGNELWRKEISLSELSF
jgi:alkaline phosphatase D